MQLTRTHTLAPFITHLLPEFATLSVCGNAVLVPAIAALEIAQAAAGAAALAEEEGPLLLTRTQLLAAVLAPAFHRLQSSAVPLHQAAVAQIEGAHRPMVTQPPMLRGQAEDSLLWILWHSEVGPQVERALQGPC